MQARDKNSNVPPTFDAISGYRTHYHARYSAAADDREFTDAVGLGETAAARLSCNNAVEMVNELSFCARWCTGDERGARTISRPI